EERALLGTTTSLMVSFAMHQWLLDRGLTPEQAKPITRALMLREQEVTSPLRGRLARALPVARSRPIGDGFVVHVTRDEVAFDGGVILGLQAGSIAIGDRADGRIPAVVEGLEASRERIYEERGGLYEIPMLIAAEADTPFATLLDL